MPTVSTQHSCLLNKVYMCTIIVLYYSERKRARKRKKMRNIDETEKKPKDERKEKRNKCTRWNLVYCFRQRLNVFTATSIFFFLFNLCFFLQPCSPLRCSLLWWLLTSMLSTAGVLLMILKCLASAHIYKSIEKSFAQRFFFAVYCRTADEVWTLAGIHSGVC